MKKEELYQKIFIKKELTTSQAIHQNIIESINNKEILLEEVVQVFLNSNTISLEKNELIEDSFSNLFKIGLKWQSLLEMNIYIDEELQSIKNINLSFFKNIIGKSIKENLIEEVKKDAENSWNLILKIVRNNLLEEEQIEPLEKIFELNKNKDKLNEFLLSIRNFNQMKKITNKLNISPWLVVKKNEDIETLLPAHVWNQEFLNKDNKNKTTNDQKAKYFIENKNEWINLSTNLTNSLQLQSRVAFAACAFSREHDYSKFLRECGIKKIDLNCIDSLTNSSKKMSLKQRLLMGGKIKIISKYEEYNSEEKNPDEKNNDFIKLITVRPNKPFLITTQKSFLKSWITYLPDTPPYEQILNEIISTARKKYSGSAYEVKCYLPLKKEYLEKTKEEWKYIDLKKKRNSLSNDNFFFMDQYQTSTRDICVESFNNFLYWINDKSLKWDQKNEKNQNLFSNLIVCLLGLESDWSLRELLNKNNYLWDIYTSLSNEEKTNTLKSIVDNWEKIWHEQHKRSLENSINSGFEINNTVLTILKNIVKINLEQNTKIESSFFNSDWKKIKLTIENFSEKSQSAKELSTMFDMLQLNCTLKVNNNIKPKMKI